MTTKSVKWDVRFVHSVDGVVRGDKVEKNRTVYLPKGKDAYVTWAGMRRTVTFENGLYVCRTNAVRVRALSGADFKAKLLGRWP
jgi:hypothetical protein